MKESSRGAWIWTTTRTEGSHLYSKGDYYSFRSIVHSRGTLHAAGPWDFFLSAYDETDRVQIPFQEVPAAEKQWVVHQEYRLSKSDWPEGAIELGPSFDRPTILDFLRDRSHELKGAKICVDATGFIRPHLLVLLWGLREIGIGSFDVLYSDPVRYVEDEDTPFTTGPLLSVEQVPGYTGFHRASVASNDLLVIGAGYDYAQIARACEQKRNSKKYLLTGLPSLQPHMYQESMLRIRRADESIGALPSERRLYASANQPFAVAQVLHDVIAREKAGAWGTSHGNLYLCPVGPKPHVLGFAIYYLRELEGETASIIYPFAESYSRLTTQGLSRTWEYRIEF